MLAKDVVISVRDVEPELVAAVKKLSRELGRPLHGVVLVNPEFVDHPERYKDESGFFKEVICDYDNPAELQKAVQPYQDRLLAVVCRIENAVQLFRKLIPFVPFVDTPSETALLWCTEKQLMRDRLATYDKTLVPEYYYLNQTDLPEFEKKTEHLKYPVIVKPNGLKASLLVTRCDTKDQLITNLYSTFDVIDEVYKKERGTGEPGILVEEMMVGDMYSTDAYVDARGNIYCLPLVRVITAHEIGQPGFYSYRHIIPVGLPEAEVQKAFKAAKASIRALNLNSSSAHIELFHTTDGWKIIELGPRIGGYRAPLYAEAYGIDHFYNDLLIRIGKEPIINATPIKHAAGFNMYPDEEGVIESIEGMEEASKLPSVVYIKAHADAGEVALFAGSGGKLIVDGILSNADPAQLEADMQTIRQIVKIRVRQPEVVLQAAALD